MDGVIDSDYGDRSGHTRVSAFIDWIDSYLRYGAKWAVLAGMWTPAEIAAMQIGIEHV